MSLYLSALFALLVLLNENLAAKIKFTNAVCESYNQSWVTIEHCRLHAIRRDKTIVTVSVNLHYPTSNIVLKYEVLKKGNGYKPWLFDGTIDACAFLRKPYNPFSKMVYKLIKNYTTVNHSCPYTGRQQLKNFYLRPEQVPLPLPSGDYAAMMTWIFYGKPQFSTNVYYSFEEDLIKQ